MEISRGLGWTRAEARFAVVSRVNRFSRQWPGPTGTNVGRSFGREPVFSLDRAAFITRQHPRRRTTISEQGSDTSFWLRPQRRSWKW
ncbi:hypothetical protein KM043_003935 [Ampulex compressa]|nr:hypothetical protein KM043_003935 [Ampulex compressa]